MAGAQQSKQGAFDLPTLTLKSDGTKVGGQYNVLSVVVHHEVNRIPVARISLMDGDPALEDFPASNEDLFAPGREIEVLAGYHSDEESIFKGIVVRHGIRSRSEAGSTLNLVCKHPAVKMTVSRRSVHHSDMKDSEVVEALIQAAGLKADVKATSYTHKQMLQYQATDWDFMVARAEANGLLVIARNGAIELAAPDSSSDSVLELHFPDSVREIDAELDSETQLDSVVASSWDADGQQPVDVDGAAPTLPKQGNLSAKDLSAVLGVKEFRLHHGGALADAELQAWGDSLRLRSGLSKIRGRIRCQGTSAVKPNVVVTVSGAGDRFNGKAIVTGVRHEINTHDWITDVQFGMHPRRMHQEDTFNAATAAGTVPAVPGLQVGIVTKLSGDPDGADRIRVRLPLVDPQDDGLWCRVCTLDAGDKRGTVFLPELDDEVLVGFLHGDPRHAVVLGMLRSSAKPSPLPADDKNPKKGFVSRAEIKVTVDDEDKRLQIEMPSGRKVTLDDKEKKITVEDGDKNTVTLSSDGIVVESGKDVQIKAKGDLKLEAINVEVKASGEFKAAGQGGSEVSSGAVTTVKGSLVQIN